MMVLKRCRLLGGTVLIYVSTGLWNPCLAEHPLPAYAQGVVFNDRDNDGLRDPGEEGIPGVKVSNGMDVTVTNEAGRYQLSVTDDTIVFVCKPRDWMTRLDQFNLPRFYYIHKPAGSPDESFAHAGVDPTGPLPESIDFPLVSGVEPEDFKVLLIADPQPFDIDHLAWYGRDVVAELLGTDAAFALLLGDLVGNDLGLYWPLNQVHARLDIPIYSVHGNHDINFESPNDLYSDETFERVYGPTNYAFQYANVHFIVLDNVRWRGFDASLPPGLARLRNYDGQLTEAQLRFVDNYLATVPEHERIVVATHIPLINAQSPGHGTLQAQRLLERLARFPHSISFAGHAHVNEHFHIGPSPAPSQGETLSHHHYTVGAASGSWYRGPADETGIPASTMADGTPNGYALAVFRDNEYSVRYKGARERDDYQLVIHAPPRVEAVKSAATEVLVNVFDGSARSRVTLRIDDRPPIEMQQTPRTDPGYQRLRSMELTVSRPGERLPAAVATSHMWLARLPADLAPGVHVLSAETIDAFGALHRATQLLRVW